ncbi:MAG: pirin family protein [Elusimicrobia bacterium]|nr:pirin family protein [Candidatus Liberimonas magnetica]
MRIIKTYEEQVDVVKIRLWGILIAKKRTFVCLGVAFLIGWTVIAGAMALEAGMKKQLITGSSTFDGAGVKLFRVFANDSTELTDPFLLLDNFGSDNPDEYLRGFPWHPHRGIETVTYMLDGVVEHGDSIGNSGVIGPGDIQWMSAGSGIIHQEMPKQGKSGPLMQGLQLWVNLPAKRKMMEPRYRGITAREVPSVRKVGIEVKVISGEYEGSIGPVKDLVVDVEYFDVKLKNKIPFSRKLKKGYTTFCYVLEGNGLCEETPIARKQLMLFKNADTLTVKPDGNMRFILVSGRPLKEPVAWGGPIVMNTQEELSRAFSELDAGTFIKYKPPNGKNEGKNIQRGFYHK